MQQDANPIFDSVVTRKLHDYFQRGYDSRVFDLFIAPRGGDAERTPDAATYSLCDRFLQELNNSPHRSHLLLGDSGLGKTTFSLWLTRMVWADLKTFQRIPLYIPLPHIDKTKWEGQLLQSYLKQVGLDEKERHQILSYPLLVILDGVDEIKLRANLNLYKLNGWGLPPYNIKVVSCCRPEALRDYSQSALFEAPGPGISSPHYATYYLQPFQDTQIQQYLQQFSQHLPKSLVTELANNQWALGWRQSGEIYYQWLTRLTSLKSLAENPFLLSLVAQALPRLVEQHRHQSDALQTHFTRNSVFAVFVDQWFDYQARRLQTRKKLLLKLTHDQVVGYLKAYAKNLAASLLDAEGKLVLELLDDAQTLKPELAEPNENPTLLAHYETQGKKIFKKSRALSALRTGCLLKTQQSKFKFLHKSLIEYLAAQQLFTGLKGEFEAYQQMLLDKSMQLNRQRLNEIKIIQSLAEHVKTDETFHGLLGEVILASKEMLGLAAAAANAITVLNAAGINFSHQDFRDVQIPGADLSGSFCYQTDFRGANLTGVQFHQAFLRGARFEGANVTDVQFGEQPFIKTRSQVRTVAFYQDYNISQPRTYLLAGCYDGYIYQFQPSTGQLIAEYEHGQRWFKGNAAVNSIAIHSPTALLASAGTEDCVKLWSLQTHKILKVMHGHMDVVNCVIFAFDGRSLASGSRDNTIRLWDVSTGHLLKTLQGHTEWVESVAFHPNGKHIISGSRDRTVRLWDVSTGHLLKTLQGHTSGVTGVVFHPNGKQIVSGSEDRTIRFWDVSTGYPLQMLQAHTKISGVAIHPEGNHLVSCGGNSAYDLSWDNTVCLWDITTGYLLQTWQGHADYVTGLAFDLNGTILASGSEDNTVHLWEMKTSQLLQAREHMSRNNSSAFHSEEMNLISGVFDDAVWDLKTQSHYVKRYTNVVTCVVFNPQGKNFASGNLNGTLCLWNVTTSDLLQVMRGHAGGVTCVAFHPDGRILASGSTDKTVCLWDVNTGFLLRTLQGHTSRVNSIAFHPEGKYLVSGSGKLNEHDIFSPKRGESDTTVRLWDATNGHLLKTMQGHPNDVIYLFYPDGEHLAVCGANGCVHLMDVSTGQFQLLLPGYTRIITCVAFHSESKCLALVCEAKPKTIQQRNVSSGRFLQVFQECTSKITSLAFTFDGKFVISGSDDWTVRLWEVKTGICLLHLQLWYHVAALSLSSGSLAVTGDNGHLTVWELFASDKLHLYWSAKPCQQLFLEETVLTQAIGLSERNRVLCRQRDAKGQPAPTTQRYQAWCSLFQPLLGTGSVSSPFSMISAPHQRLRMTDQIWVVSVARKRLGEGTHHVFLLIEGIRHHRRFMIRAELTSPDSRAVTITLTPLNDLLKMQESVRNYEANQWNITADDGIKLLNNIRTDQQTCLAYHTAGNKSVLTTFFSNSSGKEFHSCVSWCEKQLGLIGIHFPSRWYYFFVLLPSDLTLPSDHSLVPPVSKV